MLGGLEIDVGIFHIGERNENINLAASSARRMGYNPVLLTDTKTETDIPAFRKDVSGELMVKNVSLQLEYLRTSGNPVLFIDSDVLIFRDISDVFVKMMDYGCTLGLTWRDKKQFPINYGVIFALPGSAPIFEFLLGNVKKQTEDRRRWYGNQFAVLELFTEEQKRKIGRFEVLNHELGNVLMLPGRKYNFSPESTRKITDQFVVHFKGGRKSFLRESWERLANDLSMQ